MNPSYGLVSGGVWRLCGRRQSAEEKELQRLQSSLPCQPLKPADADDNAVSRQVASESQQASSSLQALQRLQPWSDDSARPFAVV